MKMGSFGIFRGLRYYFGSDFVFTCLLRLLLEQVRLCVGLMSAVHSSVVLILISDISVRCTGHRVEISMRRLRSVSSRLPSRSIST
jgi:hypothetical protein